MKDRNCVVLVQHRIESEYNDFIGKFYHFPKKYLNLLSQPEIEFVYFEPTTKGGEKAYFGYGKLGRIFDDKREKGNFFIEIIDYKPFSDDVPFLNEDDEPRETGPSYNPQNAARKISGKILDEICLDGGILLNFTADAHLVKVLGEELIATEVVGILELVKNAYDANASKCSIRIEKIPGLPPCDNSDYLFNDYEGPVVIIEDDGTGMDRNIIENGWMRPASTLKTRVKDRLKKEKLEAIEAGSLGAFKSIVKELKRLHGGRLPLGEKGVGRFATHRIGRNVLITTKTGDIDFEYLLEINWDKFDLAENEYSIDLSSIGFSLKRQKPSRDYGPTNSGTRLIIYGGRKGYEFTASTIHEINRSILKLKSPKLSSEEFSTIFECPQIRDLDKAPISDEFPPAFSLDVLVEENGVADFELDFAPPTSVPLPSESIKRKELELRKQDNNYPNYWINAETQRKRNPKCGPFFLHIEIWYRSTPWIDGPNRKAFTDHLDNFGGISIFRDGLNIFPAEWGAEVDWLRLSKRHIKKGVNISYYNIIGNLELEQSANLELIDKTDRQGLLNNEAFRDLATLVRNILFEVEIHFTGKRNNYNSLTSGYIREPKRLGQISKQGAQLIERISERYDVIQDSAGLLEGFGEPESRHGQLLNLSESLKNMQKSLKAMQEVQELLSEQAGYGLAIGVAVHEVAKITSQFYNSITKMLKTGADTKTLEDLRDASSSLKTELKRFGPLRAIRNESPNEFDIKRSIIFCKSLFERKLKKMGIVFIIEGADGFHICARFGAVNQILSNLIDNSCYWLSNPDLKDKKIIVRINKKARTLIFADTGPDIDESIRPYLFEPGYSLKVPPSGLGLYICKYYMRAMKGNIYESSRSGRINEMNGAQFVLDFSRVPEAKD